MGAFVESPISYTSEAVTYDAWSPLKALSVELLEEIVGHPPNISIGSLALISKKFGTQFRFRLVHSWQEHYSIQKFSLIARENQVALTDNFVPKHEPPGVLPSGEVSKYYSEPPKKYLKFPAYHGNLSDPWQ